MNRAYGIWFGAFGFALFLLGVQTPAQSQIPSNATCPAGYAMFDTICINDVTGDIVGQSPVLPSESSPAQFQSSSDIVCPAGYVALDEFCLNESSGDIVNPLPIIPSASASSNP